jgi:PAS domain S-box-containing protein
MPRLSTEPPFGTDPQNATCEDTAIRDRIAALEQRVALAEQSVANLSMALDATMAGCWDWNIQTGRLHINERWAAIIGYRLEEIVEPTIGLWRELCHPDDLERSNRHLQENIQGLSDRFEFESRLRHRNGHWIRVLNRGKVSTLDEQGTPLRMIGSIQEITERKNAGEEPGNSSTRKTIPHELHTLADNIPGTIYHINGNGATVLSKSPGSLPHFSREELESGLLDSLTMIHPDDRQAVSGSNMDLRSGMKSETLNYRIITKQGDVRWIEDRKSSTFSPDGNFTGINGILLDITDRVEAQNEQQRLESQLRKFQRLETIGTLAGGIAHDFNNILTPILGYAEMGVIDLDEGDALHEYFTEILQAAERAQNLVYQILTFSGTQESRPSAVSIPAIASEALMLLHPSIPPSISIEQHLDRCSGEVLADPSQIHQVIVNLCTNAFQAMEEKGGTLTIDVRETVPSAELLKAMPKLRKTSYVCLSVNDTGTGMDDTVMERIFEPFFTTKSVDKGTGLGLSVVHGIIVSCNGEVNVESSPDKGTTFSIYLPLINQKDTSEDTDETPLKGSGSILFIDDEKAAVQMMTIMLNKLGFSVQAVNSPVQALELFRENPGQFDLVITDLTMPEMTGLQLAGELRKTSPDLPVILMTGYGKNIEYTMPLNRFGISKLLKKPVKLSQLASTLNELLFNNTETLL